MTWFILFGVLLLFLWSGVSVLNGRRSPRGPAHRQQAIQRWERARKGGFLRHCATRTFPFAVGYCLFGPLLKTWWTTGQWGYPTQHLPFYAIVGLAFTLLTGLLSWKTLQSQAGSSAPEPPFGQRPD